MNDEDIDFTENLSIRMNDSSNQSNSSQTKYISSLNNKRPQVYSNYIQPNLPNQQPQAFNSKYQSNNNFKTQLHDYVKKPKISQETLILSNSSSLDNHFGDSIANQNEVNMLSSFIGLQTFESENVFFDSINDMVLFSLDHQTNSKKDKLCFKGKCSLALIYGHLEVNGYEIKANFADPLKWFDIYSPETNAFSSLTNNLDIKENKNSNSEQVKEFLVDKISKLSGSDSNNSEFVQKLKNFLNYFSSNTTTLLLVRCLRSSICNYLGYFENFQKIYHSFTGLNHSNNFQNEIDLKLARIGLYPVSLHNFNSVFLNSDEEKEVIKELSQNEANRPNDCLVFMACGGKDVGKSTFLRFWVNSLLKNYQTVAYIDCDPGQSEFTLSGCISLNLINEPIFGPPHTHLGHSNQSKSCYFLGHLSPSDCPSHYLQCIKQCYDDFVTYKASLNANQVVPLIINTMGWNQGLGLCLLKETILITKPTHLIQINHPIESNKNMPTLDKLWLQSAEGWNRNPSKNQNMNHQVPDNQKNKPIDSTAEIDYKLIVIKSRAPYKSQQFPIKSSQKRFSPRDHRNLATLAYFSNLQDPKQYKPFHQIRPYKVSWSKFALHVSHTRIQYDQLLRVFNASLVGLCVVDPKFIIKKDENSDLPKILNTYDADSKMQIVYKCLGFGIIRGINIETKEFYILTPEPLATLEQVNLLVNGMLNLPNEIFFEQDSETSCPYMNYENCQTSNDQVGQEPFQRKYLIHQQQPTLK